MLQQIINKHVVILYDSIDDLPIVKFQKFNKLMLIDGGIGSDLEAIDLHIAKIVKLMQTDINKATLELQNMRQALYLINMEMSPAFLSFVCLIDSIDGVKITDISDDNIKAIHDKLNVQKRGVISKILAGLKKKLENELSTYFPVLFDGFGEKEVYDKLRQKAFLMLDSVVNNEQNNEAINDIEAYLLSLSAPKQFAGSKSVEVLFNKQFENTCLYVSQKTGLDVKKMTVFEFYTTLEQLKKLAEQEVKALKKHGTH